MSSTGRKEESSTRTVQMSVVVSCGRVCGVADISDIISEAVDGQRIRTLVGWEGFEGWR